MQFFMAAPSFGALVLAFWVLWRIKVVRGLRVNLALALIVLEILENASPFSLTRLFLIAIIVRVFYGVVDPWNLRNILPYFWSLVLITTLVPFCFASTLLLLLFWYIILSIAPIALIENSARNSATSSFGGGKLMRLRVPIYAVIAFLAAAEVSSSIVRGLEISNVFVIATVVVYALFFLGIAIYVVVTSVNLFRFINDDANKEGGQQCKADDEVPS